MPLTREQEPTGGLLRIAIVLDSYNVSAWIARLIDDLTSADFLNVTAVVLLPESDAAENSGRQSWLFRKYATWDARVEQPEDPLTIVDVAARLAAISSATHMEELAGSGLDALVWLASRDPERALRKLARHGVWLYRQREPAHFWEIYERNPVTRSAVEVLLEGSDEPQLVSEIYSATVQGWSWRQNHQVPYWRASALLIRALRQLHKDNSKKLLTIEESVSRASSTLSANVAPTNLQVLRFLVRNAARTVSRRIRYSRKESHWFVAYRSDRSKFVPNSEDFDPKGFRGIRAPNGHFYADPFVIKWQGRNYLFVEDYLFAERRGCISVMEMGTQGVKSEAERVLDLPYHLSYPFVFEHDGGLYMIPETLGAGRIELYRAMDAPRGWELVKVLKENVQAVDTTLWVEDGRFYFFTNIADHGATVNDELYLFHADSLLGKWNAHPENPIVTDVRRSRAAGKLFRRNARLIRPGQDCSIRYGYACQLNEIDVLTPTEYRERPLARIEPDWAPGLIGTHTINSNEEFEVIDGQVYGKTYAET